MVGVTFVILTNGKNLGEYSEILPVGQNDKCVLCGKAF